MNKLSVLIPSFNSEKTIRATLESVKWADEIVVVDSFSTDQTVEICREYGAKILQHKFVNFSIQKNWAIPRCQYEWILSVDSDEVLEPGLREEIEQKLIKAESTIDAYRIPRKNFVYGKWVKHGGIYPDYQYRLFRREKGRLVRSVHEQLSVPGLIGTLRRHLLHNGFKDIKTWIGKCDRYTDYEKDEFRRKKKFKWPRLTLFPFLVFVRNYLFKLGILEGYRGFMLAILESFYYFFSYAKLIESDCIKDCKILPRDINNGDQKLSMNKCSVLIPCFNSEKTIRATLESVKWADQIVVCDSYSTDKTLEIAKKFDAKIIQQEYLNSAKKKNLAIQKCRHEWVFIVDPDEVLERGLKEEILGKLGKSNSEVNGYRIPRKNFVYGKWIKYSGIYPDYQFRLFRRDRGRYSTRFVHAHPLISGRIETLQHHILHQGFKDLKTWILKLERYSEYEAEELTIRGRKFRTVRITLYPFFVFMRNYFFKLGFLEGYRGFLLSVLDAFYYFMMYARLFEREYRKEYNKKHASR